MAFWRRKNANIEGQKSTSYACYISWDGSYPKDPIIFWYFGFLDPLYFILSSFFWDFNFRRFYHYSKRSNALIYRTIVFFTLEIVLVQCEKASQAFSIRNCGFYIDFQLFLFSEIICCNNFFLGKTWNLICVLAILRHFIFISPRFSDSFRTGRGWASSWWFPKSPKIATKWDQTDFVQKHVF